MIEPIPMLIGIKLPNFRHIITHDFSHMTPSMVLVIPLTLLLLDLFHYMVFFMSYFLLFCSICYLAQSIIIRIYQIFLYFQLLTINSLLHLTYFMGSFVLLGHPDLGHYVLLDGDLYLEILGEGELWVDVIDVYVWETKLKHCEHICRAILHFLGNKLCLILK